MGKKEKERKIDLEETGTRFRSWWMCLTIIHDYKEAQCVENLSEGCFRHSFFKTKRAINLTRAEENTHVHMHTHTLAHLLYYIQHCKSYLYKFYCFLSDMGTLFRMEKQNIFITDCDKGSIDMGIYFLNSLRITGVPINELIWKVSQNAYNDL